MPQTLERKTSGVEPGSGEKSKSRGPWSWLSVAGLWALVIFIGLNGLLIAFAGEEKGSNKDLWSGSGSIDLALNDLAALKSKPDVVLLGSSLVMYPFWAMDKEANAGIPDIFHHHYSNTLAKEIASPGKPEPVVFSLAIFGQMISDGYIYVDQYLKGDKRPEWLVVGIAPRDFSDHDLQAPMTTMSFKRLVGLSNFGRYAPLYLPTWQDKADFLANHGCFFYGRRWRLQHEVDKAVQKAYKVFGIEPSQGTGKPVTAQAGFMLTGSNAERWQNSLDEYKRRYRNIGERDLSVQMGFLERMLATCRERGIKVVIVNMPLTDVNRQLLPPGFYNSFRDEVKRVTLAGGGRVVDLGAAPEFVYDDYWDTTHLAHGGGHKLVKHLVPVLTGASRPE